MTWYLVQSAVVVVTAAAVGVVVGWVLFRRRGSDRSSPAAGSASDDRLASQLADCRERASRLVDDMGLLRRELAGRDAEITRLVEERDDAQAAKVRAQVDLANRTAELIVMGEEFERFRQVARGRHSTLHDDGEAQPRVP
ncbi:MAG: hypothetical protein ACFCVF_04055 [Kineosporiaceae bacterium]